MQLYFKLNIDNVSTKIKTTLRILDNTVLQHYNFNIALQSSEKHYNYNNHIIRTAIKLIQCSVFDILSYWHSANYSGQTLSYIRTTVHVTRGM